MDETTAFADDAPVSEGPEDARARAAELRCARQMAMLQELAEIGMQMVRAVRDEAVVRAEAFDLGVALSAPTPTSTPASPVGGRDLGTVYSRISRAVRQTMALETRFAEGLEAARTARSSARRATVRLRAVVHQGEVRDYVAQAIEAEAVERGTPEKAVERLFDDLDTRLDLGDYDEALLNGSIGELVARICADLGVSFDWTLWDDHPWAADHIRAQTASAQTAGADLDAEPRTSRDPPDRAPPGSPAQPQGPALNAPPPDSS